jgi:hypothetical protein
LNTDPKEFQNIQVCKKSDDMKLSLPLLLVTFIFASVIYCHAETLALDFSWQEGIDVSPQTVGWTFSVTSNIDVTKLGLWNLSWNPNQNPHFVGLWTDSGTLLTSTIVYTNSPLYTSPDGATLNFRSILEVELFAGQTYRIGAEFGNNPWLDFYVNTLNAPPSTSSSIIYDGAAESPTSTTLTFPNIDSNVQGFFGPDFMYIPAPVPELSTARLVSLGLGVFFVSRKSCKWRRMT